MKRSINLFCVLLVTPPLTLFAPTPQKRNAQGTSADPAWPRQFVKNGQKVVLYQPQVDSWEDYAKLHYRAAISFQGGSGKKEIYGVIEATRRRS